MLTLTLLEDATGEMLAEGDARVCNGRPRSSISLVPAMKRAMIPTWMGLRICRSIPSSQTQRLGGREPATTTNDA